jgi:signal transduction histidine kinase
MQLMIIFLLLIICLLLTYRQYSIVKDIKKIKTVLKDINSGNLNRRFYQNNLSRLFKEIYKELNTLMGIFKKNMDLKQSLEISQKRMISDISHDIRTPMTSLMGYVKALLKDRNLTEEEKRSYLEVVLLKSNSIYKLMQDFFELAKLESDDIEMVFQKLNITEKVKIVLLSFYNDFKENNLALDLNLEEKAMYVWGDSSGLDRILDNLISNAIRYGREGGKIGVNLREDETRVWVDIWNFGKGILEKDLEHIFERLYIAEKSRNEQLGGSGLGLVIVKKLIDRMNGEIIAKSIPNEITTFSFCIPKCK